MPNPEGTNGFDSFDGFGAEMPYGAIKAATERTNAAPLPTNRALGAADRARKQRGRRGTVQAPAPQATPEQQLLAAPPAPHVVWAEIAADPEASELVREFAARAARA